MSAANKRQTTFRSGFKRLSIGRLRYFPLIKIEDYDGEVHLDVARLRIAADLKRVDNDRVAQRIKAMQQRHHCGHWPGTIDLQRRELLASRAPDRFADVPDLQTNVARSLLNGAADIGGKRGARQFLW